MDNWLGINEFVAVVETQSFTQAAQQLNTSVAQVSRKVASLEQRLNSKLLLRTTRKITVTEVGAHYYQHCQHLVEGLKQADLALLALDDEPMGTLTVTAPITYGEQVIAPLLNEFMLDYPALKLQLILSNQSLDLLSENIDVAIRIGALPDSSMMANKLTTRQLHLCASPAYIARHGMPADLTDLQAHNCLIGSVAMWTFKDQGRERKLRVEGNMSCNSGVALLDAALKGIGVVQLPDHYVQTALQTGQLVPCLAQHNPAPQPISAVYANNRYLSVKVKRLLAFLNERLT